MYTSLSATDRWLLPGSHAASYLYGGVASFQQGNGQKDALMEHSVTGCVHYEVDDQIGGALLVKVALNLGQAHLTPAHGAGSGASPWKDGTLLLSTSLRAANIYCILTAYQHFMHSTVE